MAESVGELSAKLLYHTEEAQKALASVSSYAKTAKKDFRDLQSQADEGRSAFRKFFQEQRLQDRIARESTQAVLGIASALALVSSGSDGASEKTKKLQTALLTAVAGANATEFALFSVSRAGAGLGGTLGALFTRIGSLAGPIGIVVGLGAGLLTFFMESDKKSRKAADDGLKKYNDMLTTISGNMKEMTQDQIDAERSRLTAQKNMQETRLALYKRMKEALGSGEAINISPEQAAAAGLTGNDLFTMTASQLDKAITGLQDKIRQTATELGAVPNVITAKGPKSPEDARKDQAQQEKDLKDLANRIGAGNVEADQRARKEIQENIKRQNELEKDIKIGMAQEEFDRKMAEENALHQTRMVELSNVNASESLIGMERQRHELEIAKIRSDEQDRIADKELKQMDDMITSVAQVGNALHNAFSRSGDTFVAKMIAALQIVLQISRTVKAMDAGRMDSDTGGLQIVSSLLAVFGMGFAGGGYTGNMPRHRVAGVVHGGEIVFEKPIVDRYKDQLMGLRAQLQSATTRGYMNGGMVGAVPAIAGVGSLRVSGKIDISNGQAFLRVEMPGYRNWERKKLG
jgi:hypothetical protein